MQKTSLFQRKLNELSEKVSFDFEFALALEIQPFKVEVAFSVFLKYQFFKVFPGSSLTLSAKRAAGIRTGRCRGRSPLPCTHIDGA